MEFRSQPLHKDVKRVRKLQKKILFNLLDLGSAKDIDPNMEVQEYLTRKLTENPEKLAEFQDALEEFNYVATIILATGMSEEEIDNLTEEEFWEIYEKSRKALGGKTAEDFFERYSGSISLTPARGAGSSSETSSSRTQESSPAQSKGRSKAKR